MGRRGPSRSLFAALPYELRHVIRTNGNSLSETGPDLDSLRIKQELLDATKLPSSSRLLRTQPASVSPERDHEEILASTGGGQATSSLAGPDSEARRPATTVQRVQPTAGASTEVSGTSSKRRAARSASNIRAVKRTRVEGPWVINVGPSSTQPPQKRRKGKELPVFNPFIGHPWDCTGLVERYVNRDSVPDDIKKCELRGLSQG
jgi:trimethylguanosine synthase